MKCSRRLISGVLLLDKPAGLSSNQALQQVKRCLQAAKAGHTGSLDPFATGLLPICLGEATKFSHFLLEADKTYRATLFLGATSSTGDTEGEITPFPGVVTVCQERIEAVLKQFSGPLQQIPPMYSALKYQGKALYAYARAGVNIERPARQVHIRRIALDSFDGTQAVITVTCSKGTYIRTLAEDIGEALGCGAYLTALRRIQSGEFDLARAVTLETLGAMTQTQADALLLPPDDLLTAFPAVSLDDDMAHQLVLGRAVECPHPGLGGLVRLYAPPDRFLGLGVATHDGTIAPKRLLASVPHKEQGRH